MQTRKIIIDAAAVSSELAKNASFKFETVRHNAADAEFLLQTSVTVQTSDATTASVDLPVPSSGAFRYKCTAAQAGYYPNATPFVFDLTAGASINLSELYIAGTGEFPDPVYKYIADKLNIINPVEKTVMRIDVGRLTGGVINGWRPDAYFTNGQVINQIQWTIDQRNVSNALLDSQFNTFRYGAAAGAAVNYAITNLAPNKTHKVRFYLGHNIGFFGGATVDLTANGINSTVVYDPSGGLSGLTINDGLPVQSDISTVTDNTGTLNLTVDPQGAGFVGLCALVIIQVN